MPNSCGHHYCLLLDVNVCVYSPDVPTSSIRLYNFPGIGTHSFTVSPPLGRIQCIFCSNGANHCNSAFFVPPDIQYCWVDRGRMIGDICPTLLNMTSSGNRTPDLLISSLMPCPLGHTAPILTCTQRCLAKFLNTKREN